MFSHLIEFRKAPSDNLDYGFLYADWLLDGETITTSSWTIPSPLIDNQAIINSTPILRGNRVHAAGTATSVFLSGGVLNARYIVTNHIITDQGRVYARRFRLLITEPDSH